MPHPEQVSIDVKDITLLQPDGGELSLEQLPGVHAVILLRHRHCIPCQQHLVQLQQAHDNPWVGLLAVGFSPADRLAAIARTLGWTGMVLADPQRHLYRRLGISRAPWRRIYPPRTLAIYARAILRHQNLNRPQEDTRQLGGDAIMVAGTITTVWRPTSPDDRPSATDVLAAARAAVEARR